jgi:hypothetical protein
LEGSKSKSPLSEAADRTAHINTCSVVAGLLVCRSASVRRPCLPSGFKLEVVSPNGRPSVDYLADGYVANSAPPPNQSTKHAMHAIEQSRFRDCIPDLVTKRAMTHAGYAEVPAEV